MIQDDEKYKALRDQLRSLPRVKAKHDFESRLMQRIREAESMPVHTAAHTVRHVPEKKNWLASLFRPVFVPALGLASVLLIAIIAYFGYYSKLETNDTQPQQFVSSTNQGDLIIYVKKDGSEDISGNYPKEYSAVTPEDTRTGENYSPAPYETPSDFLSKPDPTRTVVPDIRNDRVSEEQKIEMQKYYDKDMEKGVDTKSERKLDDGVIMKKESKGDFKIESKGTLKSEKKNEEKKSVDEKKNVIINNNDEVNQEQNINAPTTEDDSSDQTGKGKNRISRATKKDSTKNKSESEADDKETIQQK